MALVCYEKCIECEQNEADAAPHYREAAIVVKEVDSEKYVKLTKQAIDMYSLSGRSSTGATMARDCAQKLEEEYDYENAAEMYQKASKLYEMDNQATNSQSMLLKQVELELLTKQYTKLPKIIKTYESIANKYLRQPLLKSNASKLFFISSLCFMVNDDLIGAKKQIKVYGLEDPNFD